MKKEECTVRRPRDAWRASIVTHDGGGDVRLQIPFAAPLGFFTYFLFFLPIKKSDGVSSKLVACILSKYVV